MFVHLTMLFLKLVSSLPKVILSGSQIQFWKVHSVLAQLHTPATTDQGTSGHGLWFFRPAPVSSILLDCPHKT